MSEEKYIVIGDIGGTKSIFRFGVDELGSKTYLNRDFSSFDALLSDFKQYMDPEKGRTVVVSLALAAPVLSDEVRMTNLDWIIRKTEIKDILGAKTVVFVNDLAAVGHYVAKTKKLRFLPLKPGSYKRTNNNMLVVGVGTGFGLSMMVDDGGEGKYVTQEPTIPVDTLRSYKVISTESGHIPFAPRSSFERDLLQYIDQPVISVESVISSKGLLNIYNFMVDGTDIEDISHHKRIAERKDPVKEIIHHSKGRTPCDICSYVVMNMITALAHKLQEFSLQYLPFQGIFLVGGVIENTTSYLKNKKFVNKFLEVDDLGGDDNHKQNVKHILGSIPIYIITENQAAVYGALTQIQ